MSKGRRALLLCSSRAQGHVSVLGHRTDLERQLGGQPDRPVTSATRAPHLRRPGQHPCRRSGGIRSRRSSCSSVPLVFWQSWPARDVKNWEAALFSRLQEGGTAKTRGKNYLRTETQCLSIQPPNVSLQPKIITRNFPKDFNHSLQSCNSLDLC